MHDRRRVWVDAREYALFKRYAKSNVSRTGFLGAGS